VHSSAAADDYGVPAGRHRVETVVERSRFIATIAPARTTDEARDFIDAIRREFPDATHNCWAFVTGPPGSTAGIGFSDAGEPHGTAGRPMLDVLLHSGIGDIAAVVTRWFGGVKLGRGGLARAYADAVQLALASLPLGLRVERVDVDITVPYGDLESLRRLLADYGADLVDEMYTDNVRYRVRLRAADRTMFETTLRDRTSGRASFVVEDTGDDARAGGVA
jgi:uncharacterized YigZ family protein